MMTCTDMADIRNDTYYLITLIRNANSIFLWGFMYYSVFLYLIRNRHYDPKQTLQGAQPEAGGKEDDLHLVVDALALAPDSPDRTVHRPCDNIINAMSFSLETMPLFFLLYLCQQTDKP